MELTSTISIKQQLDTEIAFRDYVDILTFIIRNLEPKRPYRVYLRKKEVTLLFMPPQ